MAKQKGRDLILKRGDGADSEAFVKVAGVRTNSLTINSTDVNITNADSAGWQEILGGAGVQSMSFSVDGVFDSASSQESVEADARTGSVVNYEIVVPDYGTYTVGLKVQSVTVAGAHDGEVTFAASFTSSGSIAFTGAT